MSRAALAVAFLILFFASCFGLRTWRHWRVTGSSGFHGVSGEPGSVEWWGGVLFAVSILLGVAAPLIEMTRLLPPLLRPPLWMDAVAIVAMAAGLGSTIWAQTAMGDSWRVGVRDNERTEFVERGPFRWVRNPIFSFMLTASAGFALFLPNPLSLAAFACLLLAVELQVRFAEEPYLRRMHGDRYADYCRRVGRFIPGVGRTRTPG